MLSKNKIKIITSLDKKKYRDKHGLFVIEGNKMVKEFLFAGFGIQLILASKAWIAENPHIPPSVELVETDALRLKKVSFLKTSTNVLALVKIPETRLCIDELSFGLSLVLDDIQNPGNLGTIIRIADWFGIKSVICSPQTVDVYNPKVLQASMGSILRVKVVYTPLDSLFEDNLKKLKIPIFGTFMDGNNIYKTDLPQRGMIVIGNEGRGISPAWRKYITEKIAIPRFPQERSDAESLNAAMATAIVCAEFRRNAL